MIYILGTGYIAQAYAKYFIINSIPYRMISRKEVLYTNPITLAGFLNTAKPELLINAAGYVASGASVYDEHKLACIYSNGVFPGFIGELCQSMNIPWVHVSSGIYLLHLIHTHIQRTINLTTLKTTITIQKL